MIYVAAAPSTMVLNAEAEIFSGSNGSPARFITPRTTGGIDLPLPAIGTFERVPISGSEYGVPVHDDLAILFLDRQKLVAGALGKRFGRFIRLRGMKGIGRQGNRGDNRDARLDSRLAEGREEPDFIDGVESDAIGDIAQKPLGSLDHALTFEACSTGLPLFLSISSRSTYSLRMCMKS